MARRPLFQVQRTTGAKAAGGGRSVTVEDGATKGATLGVDLVLPDGTRARAEDVLNRFVTGGTESGAANTLWRLIREIPGNIQALADLESAGIYVVTGNGSSVTRAIEAMDGQTVVENGTGIGGNPAVGLAAVNDEGGGELQKTAFDEFGRKTGTSNATTDDLEEGVDNLYFTEERAFALLADALIEGEGITLSIDGEARTITVATTAVVPVGVAVDNDILQYRAGVGWETTSEPDGLDIDGGFF